MAKYTSSPLVSQIRGSLGALTFKNTRNGPTVQSKEIYKPENPNRNYKAVSTFSRIKKAWSTLPQAQKTAWKQISATLYPKNANPLAKNITPYNLFVMFHTFHATPQNEIANTGTPLNFQYKTQTITLHAINSEALVLNTRPLQSFTQNTTLKIRLNRNMQSSHKNTNKSQSTITLKNPLANAINIANYTPDHIYPTVFNELLNYTISYAEPRYLPYQQPEGTTSRTHTPYTLEAFTQYPFIEFSYDPAFWSQDTTQTPNTNPSAKWSHPAGATQYKTLTLTSNNRAYPTAKTSLNFFFSYSENFNSLSIHTGFIDSQNYSFFSISKPHNYLAISEYINGAISTKKHINFPMPDPGTWLFLQIQRKTPLNYTFTITRLDTSQSASTTENLTQNYPPYLLFYPTNFQNNPAQCWINTITLT